MTKLSQHLNDAGMKRAELARTLGVSRGYVTELCNGTKRPSLKLAARIEAATGGVVTATSWASPAETSENNAGEAERVSAAGQPDQKAMAMRGADG